MARRFDYAGYFGKALAPLLSRAMTSRFLYRHTRQLEYYLEFIQGKGSGYGWDLRGETQVAADQLGPSGRVVIDVGANTGDWSLQFARAVHPRRPRILMVEPSSYCVGRLRSLSIPNSIIIPAAAGETLGKATLYGAGGGATTASLYHRRDSYLVSASTSAEDIVVTTIDHLIVEYQLPRIDLVKIDTEGHDLKVLLGSRDALNRNMIKSIIFEFGAGNINSRVFFRDFWDLLTYYGFHISRIAPGGRLIRIEEYYEDLEYFRNVSNYLASKA